MLKGHQQQMEDVRAQERGTGWEEWGGWPWE